MTTLEKIVALKQLYRKLEEIAPQLKGLGSEFEVQRVKEGLDRLIQTYQRELMKGD